MKYVQERRHRLGDNWMTSPEVCDFGAESRYIIYWEEVSMYRSDVVCTVLHFSFDPLAARLHSQKSSHGSGAGIRVTPFSSREKPLGP